MKPQPTIPAHQPETSRVILGVKQIEVVNQKSLEKWDVVYPALRLVAENILVTSNERILLYGCHQGALPTYLVTSYPQTTLTIIDHNYTAIETTRQTLAANSILLTSVDFMTNLELPAECNSKFEIVIMMLPKSRSLARRWLIQASHALAPSGRLYIAGSNAEGIQSVLKDASELFGQGSILAYKKGNRIAQFIMKDPAATVPDWALTPGIAPGTWVEFSVEAANQVLQIRSLPGIFAYDHLDEGTYTLLQAMEIPHAARVLDAGCGYGIIGMTASLLGAGRVDLIDNNLLAIAAAQETIRVNHLKNVEAFPGDLINSTSLGQYDLVISNPPFHSGHSVDYLVAEAIIRHAFMALERGGRVVIVANRFIRYDRLIEDIFGSCSTLRKSNKFHVLSGLKL